MTDVEMTRTSGRADAEQIWKSHAKRRNAPDLRRMEDALGRLGWKDDVLVTIR